MPTFIKRKGEITVENWYLYRGNTQYGPYTPEQILSFEAQHQLYPGDMLYGPGYSEWLPIEAALKSMHAAGDAEKSPPSAVILQQNQLPQPAQMAQPAQPAHTGLAMFLAAICFAVFGAVAYLFSGPKFSYLNIIFGIVVGLIFAWLCTRLMAFFFGIANGHLRQQHGPGFALGAVARGMLSMIPYAVLTFLAVYFLHWKTATLFIASAITAAGAAAGVEIGKLGKPRAVNFILPTLVAFAVSAGWMYTIGSLQVALGLIKTLIGM